MTLTLSHPVKIVALCGLLAVLLIPGGLMFMGRRSDSAPVVSPHIVHHPFGPRAKSTHRAAAPTPKQHASAAAKPHAPAQAPVKRAAPVAAKPSINRAAVTAAAKVGLPGPVAQALGRSGTVVVSLYDPYSQVDGISFAEARAGAALAHAAFVPLNVLSQAQVGKLTEQLGLLPDPGVLVYVRPARLAAKISGFADKETVAQAAANAGA